MNAKRGSIERSRIFLIFAGQYRCDISKDPASRYLALGMLFIRRLS